MSDPPACKRRDEQPDDARADVARVVVDRTPEPPPSTGCGDTIANERREGRSACFGPRRLQTVERSGGDAQSPESLSAASEHDEHFSSAKLRAKPDIRVSSLLFGLTSESGARASTYPMNSV